MAQHLDQRPVAATTQGTKAGTAPAPVSGVLLSCLALGTLSLLLPSTLTFDPLTWATWGREIVHLRLGTAGGPAWKPLPVLVDAVFAPFGEIEPWVWLVVARAGGLLAVTMAYRLARRLAGRWAGAVAAAGMLLSSAFLEYLTPLGMSEPLLAGLALLAVERHHARRSSQAYALIFASLLLRPETFPFFLAYSAFLWFRRPRSRPWIAVLTALLPVLWLLPDYLSTGDWLRSTRRAAQPTQGGPRLTSFPAGAVLESAFNYLLLPIVVGAVIAMAYAAVGYLRRREQGTELALSLLCVGWLVEVALTTQAQMGSGDERYLIVSAATACVLAGVGWTRVVTFAATRKPRAGLAVIAALVLGSAPFVVPRLAELSTNAGDIPYWAHKNGELALLIDRAGGRSRILGCGPVTADIYQMPALAWRLGIHQSQIAIATGPKGTPKSGPVVAIATTGTVFRTRTTRHSPLLPALVGPGFGVVATTAQWQVLSTCGGPA